MVTTAADTVAHRGKIAAHKKQNGTTGSLLKLSGFNIAFSQKGLTQVRVNALFKLQRF